MPIASNRIDVSVGPKKVPSAVIPVEFNYMINPDHPDYSEIKIGRKKRHALDVRPAKV
jgi:hypothetical protein